jgi:hypothetical protein
MLDELDVHSRTSDSYFLIEDEPGMMYDEIPSRIWMPDQDYVDLRSDRGHSEGDLEIFFVGWPGRFETDIEKQSEHCLSDLSLFAERFDF